MKRWPLLLTLSLVIIWLVLTADLSLLSIGFGGLLAVVVVLAIAQLRPVQPRVRNLHLAVPLIATLLLDILRSNVAVARIILGLVRDREIRSGFLEIPLQLRDPHGLAVLAMIVTSTPGTSWAGVTSGDHVLRLHVLDLREEEEWIRLFKERYERRLLRIFE